jgi:ABC-type antimicrobial peptide transport system permease subunit
MAFAVSQQTQEIGLRMALGASRGRVMTPVVREAAIFSAIGLSFGLAGALLVGHSMRASQYGVAALDFSAIISVMAILFVTALAASYLPARRAAAIDPVAALRAG